ncbi:MAG TPA: EamA family transporter, partial [Vicinamibacteria bacterium]|nr:EamA family transporter [Vicinamibacteria bacterium]
MSRLPRRARIDAALVGTVVMWAVNFSVVKAGLRHFTPMAFTTLRLLGAALCFVAIAAFLPGPSLQSSDRARFLVLGLVGHTVYQTLFIQGIHATSASSSA